MGRHRFRFSPLTPQRIPFSRLGFLLFATEMRIGCLKDNFSFEESHNLSRSGRPDRRIERLERIVGWFDKWLMGVPKPEYEVAQ